MRIFLAGATGVIGRRLVPLLVQAGHEVAGSTRSLKKAAGLQADGVKPVVLDAFDADAVQAALFDARPEVLNHQLTDLPEQFDPAKLAEALKRNARIRIEGTRNLIGAARAAGVRRVIAQSIAFIYAPDPEPHQESDPLAPAEGPLRDTMEGVTALEDLTTGAPGIEGLVLRYGHLYGPGTWDPRRRPAAPTSRSMPPRMPLSWPSREGFPASTTLPTTTAPSPSPRLAVSWAGIRNSGYLPQRNKTCHRPWITGQHLLPPRHTFRRSQP